MEIGVKESIFLFPPFVKKGNLRVIRVTLTCQNYQDVTTNALHFDSNFLLSPVSEYCFPECVVVETTTDFADNGSTSWKFNSNTLLFGL
jgi:hypothetical protein